MSDPKRIPSDGDDEWREADARPEEIVQLREKPELRLIPTDGVTDRSVALQCPPRRDPNDDEARGRLRGRSASHQEGRHQLIEVVRALDRNDV